MNHHLNLYRFFNETNTLEFLENNLSRALSIVLLNSPLFFNDFIKEIVKVDDFYYLFSHSTNEDSIDIDVQLDISKIENESYKRVYAIALTANKNINLNDFLTLSCTSNKNITDIIITIKDVLFVIEVKKTDEDCKQQLYNQISPFLKRKNKEALEVVPVCVSWHKVLLIMEKVNNLEILLSKKSPFISDFLDLAEAKYPSWFEPKPFNILRFDDKRDSAGYHYLIQRLKQGLVNTNYELLPYERLGLVVDFNWASEVIPHFHHYPKEKIQDYIVFYIWPANTKTQGYHIYNKSLDWIKKESIVIDGKDYVLEILYEIKLSHFNKYIINFSFGDKDLKKPIHTAENFYKQSGKWNINSWVQFESFLDEHFKPEYQWRQKCDWENNIINTNRTYFTAAFGFIVSAFIPFSEFCDLDRKDDDIGKVSDKINKVVESFKELIL